MDTLLTLSEIEERHPSEWVLVDDVETNDFLLVQRGTVRFHSKDRDEVYQKALELPSKRFAVLYTGSIPEDAAVIL